MKKFVLLLAAVALLAGCVHSNSTIASVRAAGVSERTVQKLEHRGVLSPNDLVELHQHRVSDEVPVRQLDRVGVDYVAQKADFKRLHSAGVSQVVADALSDASNRFLAYRYVPAGYYGYYPGPWSYGGPWWWPDISLGYVWGGGWGHWGHGGHDHGHGDHGHHHH